MSDTHTTTHNTHHLNAVLTSLLHTNHTDSSLKCVTQMFQIVAEYDKVKMKMLQSGPKSYKISRGHLRPSMFTLKEICAFQQRMDLLILKKPFLR